MNEYSLAKVQLNKVKMTFFVSFLHQNATFTFTFSVFANLFFLRSVAYSKYQNRKIAVVFHVKIC